MSTMTLHILQMGSFEMHMRGGPFVATDKPVFAIDKKKLIVPLEEDLSAGKGFHLLY